MILDAAEGQALCTGNEIQFREVEDYTINLRGLTTPIKEIDLQATLQMEVMPNPFSHQFSILLSTQSTQPATAQLLDITGSVLHQFFIKKGRSITNDFSDLPAGIYFLKIYQAGQLVTKKLVKQ